MDERLMLMEPYTIGPLGWRRTGVRNKKFPVWDQVSLKVKNKLEHVNKNAIHCTRIDLKKTRRQQKGSI